MKMGFDYAQIVNAMDSASRKTKFWKRTLKQWRRTPFIIREKDIKDVVASAWKYGKCETANVIAIRIANAVKVQVFVKMHPPIIEQEFLVSFKEV